jgi:hypothetical protein
LPDGSIGRGRKLVFALAYESGANRVRSLRD